MLAQKIYIKLQESEESSHHLPLSTLFKSVFGRKLRTTEWGHFRKLINLYGSEIVYWALLASSNIDSSGKPLLYVTKVCVGMLKETAQTQPHEDTATKELLEELRNYERPNWEEILDATD